MMIGDVMEAHSRWLGLQCGNSVSQGVFLSKGQACHGILPNEDLPDQKCRRLGCKRCWSRQNSAHGHSQMHRLLSWTVFAVALGANEVCRKELAWCVPIPQILTTKWVAAFRTIWSRRMTWEERDAVQNAVAVINSTANECSSQGLPSICW